MKAFLQWLVNFRAGQLTQVTTAVVVLAGVARGFGWIDEATYQAIVGLFGAGVVVGVARKPFQGQ
jgi:hypothetical protein